MKLLIIASPYEADGLRRAAAVNGFEAVAIEPGDNLSGWITATRPDVIVMASQIVSSDAEVALEQVRATPRGRVPIFLIGEAEEQARLQHLADGFFPRPVAPAELLVRIRAVVTGGGSEGDRAWGPGPAGQRRPGSGGVEGKGLTLRPLVAARRSEASPRLGLPGGAERDGSRPPPAAARKTSRGWPPPAQVPGVLSRSAGEANLRAALARDIDADFEAEIRDVVRAVEVLRRGSSAASVTPSADGPASSRPDVGQPVPSDDGALEELKDESSQKTLEVPLSISAALVGTDPGAGDAAEPARAEPAAGTPGREEDSAADRSLVRALQAVVREGDYFQVLAIPRDAGAEEIRAAHERRLRELSPTVLHPQVVADLTFEIDQIRLVVAEAARLLEDDLVRDRYRRHLQPLSAAPTHQVTGSAALSSASASTSGSPATATATATATASAPAEAADPAEAAGSPSP